jgi:hypothetical protein
MVFLIKLPTNNMDTTPTYKDQYDPPYEAYNDMSLLLPYEVVDIFSHYDLPTLVERFHRMIKYAEKQGETMTEDVLVEIAEDVVQSPEGPVKFAALRDAEPTGSAYLGLFVANDGTPHIEGVHKVGSMFNGNHEQPRPAFFVGAGDVRRGRLQWGSWSCESGIGRDRPTEGAALEAEMVLLQSAYEGWVKKVARAILAQVKES